MDSRTGGSRRWLHNPECIQAYSACGKVCATKLSPSRITGTTPKLPICQSVKGEKNFVLEVSVDERPLIEGGEYVEEADHKETTKASEPIRNPSQR